MQNPLDSGSGNAGQDNPLGQAWDLATSSYKQYLRGYGDIAGFGSFKAGYNAVLNSTKAPDMARTSTSAPTLADANRAAVSGQLAQERQAYSASSQLTGGAGLLDSPTTSSRVLVGS
jgi:hypothetical protein